jgi:hypothetical protein
MIVFMPELSDVDLVNLRDRQKSFIRCPECAAWIWANYCREWYGIFVDGHWPPCVSYRPHSGHRGY